MIGPPTLMLCLCVTLSSGCAVDPKAGTQNPPTPPAISEASGDIRASAQKTKVTADEWAAIAPSPEHQREVRALQDRIIELTGRLDSLASEQARQNDAHAKVVSGLEKRLADAQEEAKKRERWVWTLFQIVGGIFIVGAAIVAYVSKSATLGGLVFVAGISASAYGTFMKDWDWTLGLSMGGLIVFGACVFGYVLWRKYVEGKREEQVTQDEAMDLAKFTRDVIDQRRPEGVREFVVKLRGVWPDYDQAMRDLR